MVDLATKPNCSKLRIHAYVLHNTCRTKLKAKQRHRMQLRCEYRKNNLNTQEIRKKSCYVYRCKGSTKTLSTIDKCLFLN